MVPFKADAACVSALACRDARLHILASFLPVATEAKGLPVGHVEPEFRVICKQFDVVSLQIPAALLASLACVIVALKNCRPPLSIFKALAYALPVGRDIALPLKADIASNCGPDSLLSLTQFLLVRLGQRASLVPTWTALANRAELRLQLRRLRAELAPLAGGAKFRAGIVADRFAVREGSSRRGRAELLSGFFTNGETSR